MENWFLRIMKGLRLRPKTKNPQQQSSSSDTNSEEGLTTIAMKQELQFIRAVSAEYGFWQYLPESSKKKILERLQYLWITGWNDGERGQRQFTKDFFDSVANNIKSDLDIEAAASLKESKRKVKEITKNHAQTTKRKDQIARVLTLSNHRKQLNPAHYSWSLMILFFLLGLLVFVADIPLALMITEDVFAFEAADDMHRLVNLLLQPEDDQCGSIWIHIVQVLAANWRVVLLTLGVALCTLLFKILYDEFRDVSRSLKSS